MSVFDTFGEEIAAGLPEHRALAESRMRDTCIVEYRTGRQVQNESTGREEDEYATRFLSPCRIKDQGYADSGADVGGRREAIGTTMVHLPWDVAEVQQNDRITITAISPTTAARHLGKRFYIGTDHDRSDATATRLVVKEDPWQST